MVCCCLSLSTPRCFAACSLKLFAEFGYSRGYRVNVLKNSCLNNYIRTHYTKVNGAFENADGDKFIEHTYVWEIVFF